MTRGELITLALGDDESRKVDTAIPQAVFDAMTEAAREDIAGWFYDVNHKLDGRLLTQSECWQQIRHHLDTGRLAACIGGFTQDRTDSVIADITHRAKDWPCLRQVCERGDVHIQPAPKEPTWGERIHKEHVKAE